MPTAQEILVHIERAQAQHIKAAGWLSAGNGGALLAFTVFKEHLAPPHNNNNNIIIVSSIGIVATIAFLATVLIIRKITKDPPHPSARLLILLNIGSVLIGLASVIVASVICLVWFVMGW